MKILVVGGGGREHAIIKKLKQNPEVTEIFALPGNGGIAADAECINISAKDIPAIQTFAIEKKVDYAVWMRWRRREFPVSALVQMPRLLKAARSFPKIS